MNLEEQLYTSGLPLSALMVVISKSYDHFLVRGRGQNGLASQMIGSKREKTDMSNVLAMIRRTEQGRFISPRSTLLT